MLIQKMLGMHKPEDYCFAVYWNATSRMQSLLVKTKNGYFDVLNKYPIFSSQVSYKENLTDYVKFDKEYITNRTAKDAAEPHYDTFSQNSRKHEEQIIAKYSNCGFEF